MACTEVARFGTADIPPQSSNSMQINGPHPYYAHSAENLPESQWQTLHSHHSQAGEMSAGFASVFGAQEVARYAGQLHDLGKYSEPFDKRLHGGPSVDHATAGAKIAVERWGLIDRCMVLSCISFIFCQAQLKNFEVW